MFTLNDSRDMAHSLSDDEGKIVFINFWASWCAPCRIELPELSHLADGYTGKKVHIVVINVDKDRAGGLKALHQLGLDHSNFKVLWDNHSKVVSAFDIQGMPSSFILDSQGIIRFQHEGYHPKDPMLWRKEIDALLR